MQDYADQVAALRPMLLRVARKRLRNTAWAEDAVSETMVAALEKPHSFAGRSTLQAWLVGILNHQAVNQIRRNTRESQLEVSEDGVDCESNAAADGDEIGDTRARLNDPQECLHQRQFVSILDR
ncbi:MAG: sigma factor [Betaproteobacteria bacterium]